MGYIATAALAACLFPQLLTVWKSTLREDILSFYSWSFVFALGLAFTSLYLALLGVAAWKSIIAVLVVVVVMVVKNIMIGFKVEEAEDEKAHRGFHIILDYSLPSLATSDPAKLATWTKDLITRSITNNGVRIVHQHLVVLEGDRPGFSVMVLVDESHVIAHCYTDTGLLALDVFTCGCNPAATRRIADDLDKEVRKKYHVPHFSHRTTGRFPANIFALDPREPDTPRTKFL